MRKRWQWLALVMVLLTAACAYAVGSCRSGALYCVDSEGYLHVQGVVATPGPSTIDGLAIASYASPVTITAASIPQLRLNTTSGSNQTAHIQFQQSGTTKWTLASDFAQGNASEFYLYDAANNRYPLTILSDGTTSLAYGARIDGLVNLAAGSAVNRGQILFPATQVASSDTNTLDDYEEGTWTPSVGGTATYNTQMGQYTKIGRLVTATGAISIDTIGTGSTSVISGLPFTSAGGGGAWTAPVVWLNGAISPVYLVGYLGATNATVTMYGITAAGSSLSIQPVMGNGTNITFTMTYFTS